MKNLFLLGLSLLFAVGTASCTKEVPAELNVTTTELSFTKEGGSQSISFSTNKNWTASSSASWVKVQSSGTSESKSISVNVDANSDYDDRSATITIKAEDLVKTVNIKQSTNLGLLLAKNKYELTNDAQTIEVEVQANVEFEYTIDDACKSWITASGTKALSSSRVKFDVAKNESYDGRSGKIVFKQKGGNLAETVTVNQSQINGLFITTPEYAVSNTEHDITVEVKANVEFEVSSEVDWIQYVETKALKTSNISLKIYKNETYDKRIGKVNVKQKNGSLSGVITITQNEGLGLILSPDSFELSNAEQTASVEVKSNVAYDVIIPEAAQNWLSLSSSTKSLVSETKTFNVAINDSIEDEREASVTFKQKDGELCGTVKFLQKPKESTEVKISSFNIGVVGGTFNLEVSHNIDITDVSIEESAKDWIQRIDTKNLQTDMLCFEVKENETDNDRKGTITISFGSVTKEVSVSQLGNGIIQFSNNIVKYACVQNYDTDGDGEISRKEAAAVTDMSDLFAETGVPAADYTFHEMKYFTSATVMPDFGGNLTELTIPNSVSTIPDRYFRYNKKLVKLDFYGTFPTLTIGERAFESCEGLNSVMLPEGLKEIKDYAFSGCVGLELSMPSTIETIGSYVFSGNVTFKSFVFRRSLVSIGCGAFEKANFSGTTTFESNNIIIGADAFKQACLKDIVFEAFSVKKIDKSAFEEAQMESVEIKKQDNLCICASAFKKSTLKKVVFHEGSVMEIMDSAFDETQLESLSLPSMASLSAAFNNNTNLKDVSFNGTIENVGNGVFKGCTSIKTIHIPAWMTEIPEEMFAGCLSLTDVQFAETTKTINRAAFKDCPFYKDRISAFTIPQQIESIKEGSFNLVLNFIIEKADAIFDIAGNNLPSRYSDYYVPGELLEIYRNRFSETYNIYDIKEFPRRKPTEPIPEGFVDMGLPAFWAKEDYNNGEEFRWPGTNLDYDRYRVATIYDLEMLLNLCTLDHNYNYTICHVFSPYTQQSIDLPEFRWLSDESYPEHGYAMGFNDNGKFGAVSKKKNNKFPVRMVYSSYAE